jgi:hypothetical protein
MLYCCALCENIENEGEGGQVANQSHCKGRQQCLATSTLVSTAEGDSDVSHSIFEISSADPARLLTDCNLGAVSRWTLERLPASYERRLGQAGAAIMFYRSLSDMTEAASLLRGHVFERQGLKHLKPIVTERTSNVPLSPYSPVRSVLPVYDLLTCQRHGIIAPGRSFPIFLACPPPCSLRSFIIMTSQTHSIALGLRPWFYFIQCHASFLEFKYGLYRMQMCSLRVSSILKIKGKEKKRG